ncbi:Delta11-desaturase [Operophtera brumata]|uniref:Delta11-desaturase n=1 Tax=Operophtera brumata TaxID=104452 RepID=A0A0L7KQ30_OPEBR|nr:Delta11-desaturase [Operophtera brumata]
MDEEVRNLLLAWNLEEYAEVFKRGTMAPCTKPPPTSLELSEEEKPLTPQAAAQDIKIIKTNLVTFGYGHLAALYGLYLGVTSAHWGTLLLAYIIFVAAAIGVTAGAHRLWAHRTYKATLPLQILLMIMNTFAFQNTAITDTEADPHNATRGFFYSHMGWLLVKKNEHTLSTAWHITVLRYILNLHITFLVNSAAHFWGNKPYDKSIRPVQSLPVSFVAFGEGFHNYHHVFPWDYKAAELGNNRLNVSTKFIDFFAWLGWAYDLKSVPDEMVRSRADRTGDGTNLWGWGDVDMDDEMRNGAVVLNKAD